MTIPPINTSLAQMMYTIQSGATSSNPFVTYYSVRDPTIYDINYPIQKRWINFALTKEWILESFVSTGGSPVANWVLLNFSGTAIVNTLRGDDGITVSPDGTGNINLLGNVVANSTHPKALFTDSPAPFTERIDLQVTTTLAATDPTLAKVGLAVFNSANFSVDANGFVSLTGGVTAVQSVTGNDGLPVVPTAGNINLLGAVVANGTDPAAVYVKRTAVSTDTIDVQLAAANAVSLVTKAGLASFNSTQFAVDANGFVTLSGGGLALDSLGVQATSGTGTNPVLPDGTGKIEIQGALVAAGTNPLRSVSTATNTLQLQVQTSQALAASDSTRTGLSNFNNTQFTVDAGGFVSLIVSPLAFVWNDIAISTAAVVQNGYFATAPLTLTLPAAPAQGDSVLVDCNTAGAVVVDAPGTQVIRLSSSTTIAGGTLTSTGNGDTLWLVYRAATTTWNVQHSVGNWLIA